MSIKKGRGLKEREGGGHVVVSSAGKKRRMEKVTYNSTHYRYGEKGLKRGKEKKVDQDAPGNPWQR